MRVLFLGDIVGSPGRSAVRHALPNLKEETQPDFVIVNGENAAAGFGITPDIATGLFEVGVDAITLGNHAFDRYEIVEFLGSGKPIIRPANLPPGAPGKGTCILEKGDLRLAVLNACGRIFMDRPYDDPFRCLDALLESVATPARILDFHAEATSEKTALAWYLDGRVSAVLGTHTHVQTTDERILPRGTAFLSDVGMCGPRDSVIGLDVNTALQRMTTLLPQRFKVACGPSVISGVVLEIDARTGVAESITRIQRIFEGE